MYLLCLHTYIRVHVFVCARFKKFTFPLEIELKLQIIFSGNDL